MMICCMLILTASFVSFVLGWRCEARVLLRTGSLYVSPEAGTRRGFVNSISAIVVRILFVTGQFRTVIDVEIPHFVPET